MDDALEVKRLALELIRANDNDEAWHQLDVKRLTRWGPFSFGFVPSGVDFLLTFVAVDSLLDVNTIVVLLMAEHYIFAAVLATVFNASFLRTMSRTTFQQLKDARHESLTCGYLSDGMLAILDEERGFEAFFSLSLTSYSMLFSVTTPLQLFVQVLSLLSSAWGMATTLQEFEDLRSQANLA